MTPSERVFALITERRTSAAEVSKATGISQGNFTDWKKGRSNPGRSALVKLAEYFNVTVDYFTGPTDLDYKNKNLDTSDLSWAMYEGFKELSEEDKREMLAILEVKRKLKGKK